MRKSADNFISLYRRSIALRLRSDVPVGISLSGGLDSSSMAYLAREMSPDNFVAFTANIVGKERWEGSTDTENPQRLCNDLKIQQISTVVDFDFWNRNIVDIARNYDEIFLNSGTLIFYAISAAAQANGVKVLLSGVGGDELFGGYPWQARMRSLRSAATSVRDASIPCEQRKRFGEIVVETGAGNSAQSHRPRTEVLYAIQGVACAIALGRVRALHERFLSAAQ